MNTNKKYDIAFSGLKLGKHQYQFEIDGSFFKEFEEAEVTDAKLNVDLSLEKLKGALRLRFEIEGEAEVECDRCLEGCWIPVEYQGVLDVKFTDEQLDPLEQYDGDVLWLNTDEGVINVAHYMYESIMLSLPLIKIHPEDDQGNPTCNSEMLKLFKIVSQEEFDELTALEMQKMEDTPEGKTLLELKAKLEAEKSSKE